MIIFPIYEPQREKEGREDEVRGVRREHPLLGVTRDQIATIFLFVYARTKGQKKGCALHRTYNEKK